jgi:hypothetical protein
MRSASLWQRSDALLVLSFKETTSGPVQPALFRPIRLPAHSKLSFHLSAVDALTRLYNEAFRTGFDAKSLAGGHDT